MKIFLSSKTPFSKFHMLVLEYYYVVNSLGLEKVENAKTSGRVQVRKLQRKTRYIIKDNCMV